MSDIDISILDIWLNLYSIPSITMSIEFSNLYSGMIFIIDSLEKIMLDVKDLYALVFIG